VEKVKELPVGHGLNSATGEYGDMIAMGIIDPVKVTRFALQNAASVASMILITEATVSDTPKTAEDRAAAQAASAAAASSGGMY